MGSRSSWESLCKEGLLAEDGLLRSVRLHQAEIVVNSCSQKSQGEQCWASSDSSPRPLKMTAPSAWPAWSARLEELSTHNPKSKQCSLETDSGEGRTQGEGGNSACWVPTSTDILLSTLPSGNGGLARGAGKTLCLQGKLSQTGLSFKTFSYF